MIEINFDLLHPGEYVFIPKRPPEIKLEYKPLTPPTHLLKRLWWYVFGEKYEMKKIVELMWPEIDTVIINCPTCEGA